MIVYRKKAAAVFAAFFLLTGCACGLPAASVSGLDTRLATLGFEHHRIDGAGFPLHAWLQMRQSSETLTVVIEGDGAAWFNPRWPPHDPTPASSQIAALAAVLPGPTAYLARPCQFERAPACQLPHWTTARFAPELVLALDQALDRLKQISGARHVRLIGHSGGGVMAVLLAQRRHDVSAVVTFMAPLALEEWTRNADITPLVGDDPLSLPALTVPAWHVAGGRDAIVRAQIIEHYVAAKGGKYVLWPEADHACWSLDVARRVIEELP